MDCGHLRRVLSSVRNCFCILLPWPWKKNDMEGWSVILDIYFFPLTDKSIISSRSVHLHFPLQFHFLHMGCALHRRCCVKGETALLQPETLQTWLKDDFIPGKSPPALCSCKTHQGGPWTMSLWEMLIFASQLQKSTNRNVFNKVDFYGNQRSIQ